MYDYAIRFEQDDSAPGVAVFCRDLPELNSYGDDREHAIREALDAIETTLSLYVDQRRAIPAATPPEGGEHVLHLPAVTVAKIVLWNEMMRRGMRKADLCRLLGIAQTQGDRLVDFLHTSKMEQLESALGALGIRLSVTRPPILLLAYDDSPERKERLAKVLGYVQAVADFNKLPSMPGRVVSLHDEKGILKVNWNEAPSEQDKHAFALAWQSDVGDGSDQIEHLLMDDLLA